MSLRAIARQLGGVERGYAGPRRPLEQKLRSISALDRREEAKAFLQQFSTETGRSSVDFQRRWADVRRALKRSDTYEHTPEELAFGARIAWRNHGRCIGRLFWESLEVVDCRHLVTPEDIAGRMFDHMGEALGDGRIRSMISIFRPVVRNELPAHIESGQITQYAGHIDANGRITGDRQNVEQTRIAESLGWQRPNGTPGRFDMLPLLLRDRRDQRMIFPVPPDCYREVEIVHPSYPAVRDLGLRWYAVPCVSNMVLTIGGIDYPCAPFNGFYMCTEIASRNFPDAQRYALLPEIAQAMGLEPDDKRDPLWRDTALTEMNRAVSHSYQTAGVTMVDHHTASREYMEFMNRESGRGRHVPADWRWIVPPQGSSCTDVFHLRMRNFHPVPNFYTSRASDGYRLMPYYGDRQRRRISAHIDRIRRRWKLWRRMPW